ncbi:MAG: hypothetical protein ACI9XU_001921 [Arenicella sp.]
MIVIVIFIEIGLWMGILMRRLVRPTRLALTYLLLA